MLQTTKKRLLPLFLLFLLAVMPLTAQKAAADSPDALTKGRASLDADVRLIPGGDVFGVRVFMPGVMVASLCDVKSKDGIFRPAEEGGILKKDMITHVNGCEIHHAKQLTDMVEKSNGDTLALTVQRKGETLTLSLTPVLASENGRYRLGLIVRDRTAGIGTVTFVNPQTGEFGGLGHGICDPETGEVVPLARGSVTDVHLVGISRGASGAPGELRGVLGHSRRGALTVNSASGVFGVLTDLPQNADKEALPIARANQVKEGKAHILCTLSDGEKCRYEIEITKINEKNKDSKCFSLRVKDPALIEKTGGIVQGMSGSPIIQNGRLVGAVTHVTVNDPTAGYGIFIENMLAAMPMPLKKVA